EFGQMARAARCGNRNRSDARSLMWRPIGAYAYPRPSTRLPRARQRVMLLRWPTCSCCTSSRAPRRDLRHRHACAELLSRVLRNFDVIALALMPDHIHLLAEIERASALRTFGRVLSAFRSKMSARTDPD